MSIRETLQIKVNAERYVIMRALHAGCSAQVAAQVAARVMTLWDPALTLREWDEFADFEIAARLRT